MSRAEHLPESGRNEAMATPWGSLTIGGWRKAGVFLLLGLAFFLIGLVPMWLREQERTSERDAAHRELRLSQLQNAIGAAAVTARRGDYEPARQVASDFFTALRREMDESDNSALTETSQRESLKPLLDERDEVITLLARGDPASADRLSEIFVQYRKIMSSRNRSTIQVAPVKQPNL
jgi:hypothetical protein